MTEVSEGIMSPDVQIRCAIEEGMVNIARAIFGENLPFIVKYTMSTSEVEGVSLARATATAVVSADRSFIVKANVPVRHPDAECLIYRIDDVAFSVEANDWTRGIEFRAWCENNPYNGAKVIVRAVYPDDRDRWLVADSMEGEVLYRGSWETLFPWAKQVVIEKSSIPA